MAGGGGSVDISEVLFKHVANGDALDLFPMVPEIPLPFGMTVHCFMLFLSTALILLLFVPVFKRPSCRVSGLAVALESVVLFVRNDIVYPVMGEKRGEVWLPFMATLFIFILTMNFVGLVPAFKTATGNINVTSALAVLVMLLIFVVGFKNLGFVRFFKNMWPDDTPLLVGVFILVLEVVGLFIKSMVLSLRLFANMFAGHLAILAFIAMIFTLSAWFAFVSVPFAVFTYLLEVLIALIQAFVFTLLSCLFIDMASTAHG